MFALDSLLTCNKDQAWWDEAPWANHVCLYLLDSFWERSQVWCSPLMLGRPKPEAPLTR